MSTDWFCKIGDKKVGPLNGQQLKTIVAKGQLKPDHLVRRGSEGPWVPAGRIKGLFPEGTAVDSQSQGERIPATAKPLPKAATKSGGQPIAQAASLPTAAQAPAPPPSDVPQELMLGEGGHHHVAMNVYGLNIDALPVTVSRRKIKAGMQGLKKEERKKLTMMLWCFGGGGIVVGLVVIISAVFSSNQFAAGPKTEEAKEPPAAALPADSSGKKPEKAAVETAPAEDKEPSYAKKATVDTLLVGAVEVMVLNPTRGAPAKGVKTDETYVFTVPVRLSLKPGETKPVALTSWGSDSLKKKVLLKDDQDKTFALLDQVPVQGDGKTITKDFTIVNLVFQAPTSKKLKFLHLALPSAAFQAAGPMMGFTINPNDIEPDKPAAAASGADSGDSKAGVSKGDK